MPKTAGLYLLELMSGGATTALEDADEEQGHPDQNPHANRPGDVVTDADRLSVKMITMP
jgi:hypothetical protein